MYESLSLNELTLWTDETNESQTPNGARSSAGTMLITVGLDAMNVTVISTKRTANIQKYSEPSDHPVDTYQIILGWVLY